MRRIKKRNYAIPLLFIIVGILISFYPALSNLISQINQSEVIREYQKSTINTSQETINKEYKKAVEYNKQLAETDGYETNNKILNDYNNILNLQKNSIMAYIELPSINEKLPIYHGTEDKALQKGVGHLKQSSIPIGGVSTHAVLAGHTGLAKSKLFTNLNKVKIDDVFYINVLDKTLKYKVYKIDVVLPNEVETLKIQEGQDLCTLVTCTPYGVNTHRLLVQGKRCADDTATPKDSAILKTDGENKTIEKIFLFTIVLVLVILFIIIVKLIKRK